MKLLWIICYPLALFLDWLLGIHSVKRFEKNDLKAIIELHEIKKKEKRDTDKPHQEDDTTHDANKYILYFSKFSLGRWSFNWRGNSHDQFYY